MDINFHHLNLTRGSSCLPLPDWVSRKGGVINSQNLNDKECFKWAVIAGLHYSDIRSHPDRTSNLRRLEYDYDWDGLEFSLSIKGIKEIERRNYAIVNMLGVVLHPQRKEYDYQKEVVNLLLIDEGRQRHYTAFKNLSRLLSSRNSRHGHQQHFCINCFQGFPAEISRAKHLEYCIDKETVRTCMPKPNSLVKFHDEQYQSRVPFIMYVHFGAILQPIKRSMPNPEMPYTKEINKHVPSGFCMNSKFAYGKVENLLNVYRGEDCIEVLCDCTSNEARRVYYMSPKKPMKHLTREQWRKHNRATTCHICFKEFKWDDPKVRDHCHYTGRY